MATMSVTYERMGLFDYHNMEGASKVVNVVNDLLSIVQNVMKAEATVTYVKNNRSVWNIWGPSKQPRVTVQYDHEQTAQNNVEPTSAEDDGIEVRTGNETYVNHHPFNSQCQFQSSFSTSTEETTQRNTGIDAYGSMEETAVLVNVVSLATEDSLNEADSFEVNSEGNPTSDIQRATRKVASDAHDFNSWPSSDFIENCNSEAVKRNLPRPAKREPEDAGNGIPEAKAPDEVDLQGYGSENGEESDRREHRKCQSDKEHESVHQMMDDVELLDSNQASSILTTKPKEQFAYDEDSSGSSLPEVFSRAPKGLRDVSADEDIVRCNSCEATFACSGDLASHECPTKIHSLQSKRPTNVSETIHSERPEAASCSGPSQNSPVEIDPGGGMRFSCSRCKGKFISELALKKHMRNEHMRNEHKLENLPCYYCKKVVRGLADLIHHERTHTRIKPYKCSHCQKAFGVKCNLKTHEKTHTKEKTKQRSERKKVCSTKGKTWEHVRNTQLPVFHV